MDLIEETLKSMEELEKMNENSVPAVPPSYTEKEEEKKKLTTKKNKVK
jgi:hypothetical protein